MPTHRPFPAWSAEVHPSTASDSRTQAAESVYHGHTYGNIDDPGSVAPSGELPVYQDSQTMQQGDHVARIVYYMMATMEPTDRCLRMPGDIYPPYGRKAGVRPPDGAAIGEEPWDGVSDPVEREKPAPKPVTPFVAPPSPDPS